MTGKKQAKNVADMAVLTDIRGLLSSAQGSKPPAPAVKKPEKVLTSGEEHLIKELQHFKELTQQQQIQIEKLTAEKQELAGQLQTRQAQPKQTISTSSQSDNEIAELTARKEELSLALSRIEDVLQIKTKDLIRRISRIYEEAGDFEAGRDFRHISNQLEAAESFGEFLRSLLRD
jgi:hypothetical protein